MYARAGACALLTSSLPHLIVETLYTSTFSIIRLKVLAYKLKTKDILIWLGNYLSCNNRITNNNGVLLINIK